MSTFSMHKLNVFKKILPSASKGKPQKKTDVIQTTKKSCLEDFNVIRTVGTGSFGRVFLAKRKDDPKGVPIAIKRLKKADIINHKQVDHIAAEKSILSSMSHPFIVKCVDYFKDTRYLYLCMEFVVGGEFFTHLRKCRRFEDITARFYSAQITLVFSYLHTQNVVYRDLKPENVLMSSDGYLKLADFGFAKIIEYRTYTLCGTPEYIAPEILLNKGHGKAVDWWTIGILIYEMIVGHPPFYDEEPMGIYQKILNGDVRFPSFFDSNAKHLVKKLLTQDVAKRYGNMKNGPDDIKNHPWFKGFKWDELYSKRIIPPYRPLIKSMDDDSNFEKYPDSLQRPPEVDEEADPFTDW